MTEKKKFYVILSIIIVAILLAGLFVSMLSSAEYPLQRHIAFLYVGRDTGKKLMQMETEVQDDLVKMRDDAGLLSGDLPVVSYHFNKKPEKEACMDKFSIFERQLPFLGVVELDDKDIPVRVIERIDCVEKEDKRIPALFKAGAGMLRGSGPAAEAEGK